MTLTKKMSESLTEYLQGLDLRVRYMHHETETLERVQTLRDLRMGEFDVLVGINLLREGLDLPEVSLIAILDADKECFLRNERSLIQIIGRAARNAEGEVIMYADTVTPSMESAIKETERRRSIQEQYNKEHGIIPKTIIKPITEVAAFTAAEKVVEDAKKDVDAKKLSPKQLDDLIKELSAEMKRAAKNLDFEYAATLRDRIKQIQAQSRDAK